jgi:hypothetical protein
MENTKVTCVNTKTVRENGKKKSALVYICVYWKFMRQRLGRIHDRQAAYPAYPYRSGHSEQELLRV